MNPYDLSDPNHPARLLAEGRPDPPCEDSRPASCSAFPVGWWIVYPGSEKLDLGPRNPIAAFEIKEHAESYGAQMWPGLFDVEQNTPNSDA